MTRLRAVVIRCADPATLAAFWGPALGMTPARRGEDVELSGGGIAVRLTPARGLVDVRGRVLLDVTSGVDRLLALGARYVRDEQDATVLADPEGNEFRAVPLGVTLRPTVPEDLPVIYEHQADKEAARQAVFPSRDREAFMAHWARIMADPTTTLRTVLVDGVVAGSLVSWDHEGRRDLGYWIGREHWGRGVATAAVLAFLEVDTHRPLYADPFESNAASVGVLRRCGFVEVGRETGPAGTQVVLVKGD